jgi:hypothetical protein
MIEYTKELLEKQNNEKRMYYIFKNQEIYRETGKDIPKYYCTTAVPDAKQATWIRK